MNKTSLMKVQNEIEKMLPRLNAVSWGTGQFFAFDMSYRMHSGTSLMGWVRDIKPHTRSFADTLWGVKTYRSKNEWGFFAKRPSSPAQWVGQFRDLMRHGLSDFPVAEGSCGSGQEGYASKNGRLSISILDGVCTLKLVSYTCEDWGIANGNYRTEPVEESVTFKVL